MDDYSRLIVTAMLLCGFGPIIVIVVFCLLTGRLRWLFFADQNTNRDQGHSVALTIFWQLAAWLFWVYLILLGFIVYLGMR